MKTYKCEVRQAYEKKQLAKAKFNIFASILNTRKVQNRTLAPVWPFIRLYRFC
ncbi:unknown protein [Cronobacter turicensis z3032]|uniref:Uncharacterized protein n=1 Tax=Cronobacter turicensis (strain DSM 18703 / CCUG 55852 / LMG 23827 / z3032) TaxID=693216 RepID=C9Y0P9_CROTZ|nr:unknown protein [Cronobacter turicensis z3032]